MATIKLIITVERLDNVMLNYDQIKVYRSTTGISGVYSEITGPGTRIDLVADVVTYEYNDTTGDPTYWYRTAYFHSVSLLESGQGDPRQGEDAGGLYCTVDDLRDEGVTVTLLSDANALKKIRVASSYIERVTSRWFEPRTRVFYLDGDGNSALRVGHPIIEITGIATVTGRGADIDEDVIELNEVRIYNRHLTQGLTRPDDRARPRIEFPQLTDPWAQRDVHDGFWRAIRQWRDGRVNVKVEGVFGYTELQPGDQVGETSMGSQVPLSYGSTPALISEACKALVVRDLGQMGRLADREDWANRYRIEMEKTRDQQYKITSLDKLGLSGAWTGDPYIDGILAMFVATKSQVEAV